MKLHTLILFIFAILPSSLFASEYEVTIDGKTYEFFEEKEQGIILKDGRRVQISVKGGKYKTFKNQSLSFRYLKDTDLVEKLTGSTNVITLKSSDFAFLMIQTLPPETNANDLKQTYVDSYIKTFTQKGIKIVGKPVPCVRTIAGVEQKGTELSITLVDQVQKIEFYAVKKNGKMNGMIFQYTMKFKKSSMQRFDVITESFK